MPIPLSERVYRHRTALRASGLRPVQIWVPERAFNVMDWVANVAGVFLGTTIIKIQDSRHLKG